MSKPFAGVRILDFTRYLAGPYGTYQLALLGADVIKIESQEGDETRISPADRTWAERKMAPSFLSMNGNKRSITLDLRRPEAIEVVKRLAVGADVVWENFRGGVMDRLGIGYDAVKDRCPHIVYCSISGFGQDGPYRDRAALDLIVQAESGMISVTGPVGGPGVRCGVSVADIAAGMFAAFGIMTAIHARRRTGRGQFVDVSMLQGQLSLLHGVIGAHLADGVVPAPMGTAYASLLPYQTFKTRSKDLALGVGECLQFGFDGGLFGVVDEAVPQSARAFPGLVAGQAKLLKEVGDMPGAFEAFDGGYLGARVHRTRDQ